MSSDPSPADAQESPAAAGGPVPERSRIEFLDVLRGVAVLGILLANMPYMSLSGTLVGLEGGDYPGGDRWVDQAALWGVRLLADTKFITIFSLLFGAGLALMGERCEAEGRPTRNTFGRRLGALLLFGLAHGFLLWFGDILASYALLGFAALAFRRRETKTLAGWSLGLFLFGGSVVAALSAIDPAAWVEPRAGPDGVKLSVSETLEMQAAEYSDAFRSGDFLRMMGPRAEIFGLNIAETVIGFGSRTIAVFLLGMLFVRIGLFKSVASHREVFRRLLVWGAVAGVPMNAVSVIASATCAGATEDGGSAAARVVASSTLYFGGFAVALGYAGGIGLWSLSNVASGLRRRLAAVGRTAFSNYILHSVITAILFNYLGLFDRVRRPEGLLLAFAVFALQLWASPSWLGRFRFGPLEWIWRAITYWKPVPLRRGAGGER
jgi:uncharacterized protein